MPTGYDYDAARSRTGARQRIIQIYSNRGLPPPSNIERQIDRIVGGDGPAYFDQIRSHADRNAREQGVSGPVNQKGTGSGDSGSVGSRSAVRERIISIYANRGLPPPSNIERQIDRIVGPDGPRYYDQIRSHADRNAREAAPAPGSDTGTVPGDRDHTSAAKIRRRIVAIYKNRGLPPPDNIDRQVRRVLNEGISYYGQIRSHADRNAREAQQRGDDGLGNDELTDRPPFDYNKLAANKFPWLTPSLRAMFADEWAATNNPQLALDKIRQTAEYDRVFPGNRRDDGSLRMSENEYFSEQAGFREALSEYGHNPKLYEGRFPTLFRNEVDARELYTVAQQAHDRFVEPGGLRSQLADDFLSKFVESGSAEAALEEVRSSAEYDRVFEGNLREDGTIRMDEPEFFAYKRGWQRSLLGYGLDPREFTARGHFRESVEGEQSIDEVNQRLQSAQDGIVDKVETVQRYYAEGYGLELTPESILGASIDPDIGRDLLERRITAGQIGGEAALQGFAREIERAEELARSGLGQPDARELYSSAASSLRGLSGAARRANLGDVTLGNFEDAFALSDASQRRRIERGLRRDESGFSTRANVRRDEEGDLTGLRQS